MPQTVREVTYELLRALGLTTVFGNPGSTEETFLKDFPPDFRFVLALQESTAVAAADGFAQVSRRPALVNVHTAAGLGNAMGTVVTAFMNRTPLILTAGNQTREMLLLEPWLTNVEPETLARPWVKWAYQPVRAQDVPAAFMRAVAIAVQPPAGPVFLSLPLDDWDRAADGPAVVRTVGSRVAPDPTRLREFAAAVDDSRSPVLILGAAVARGDGWDAAVALADRLGVPVWAAPASERAPFPEDHPLYAGGLPFATGPLAERLSGHDLALVIGAPVFRYYPYVPGSYLPDGMRLLHVTDDPQEAARAPVGDSLLSDAVLALDGLKDLVRRRRDRREVTPQEHRMAPHPPPRRGEVEGVLSARRALEAVRAAVAPDAVLVEESPSSLPDLHAVWPIIRPDSFYTFASGGLGWGLPASVGIALAERDAGRGRLVVAVIGDGSLQYSVQALWTAAQHGLAILVVVLRNGEYAILKSFADLEHTPGVPGLDIPGLDVTALAAGYGCRGLRATTAAEIGAAVDEARAHSGPTVLEVIISPTVPPLV